MAKAKGYGHGGSGVERFKAPTATGGIKRSPKKSAYTPPHPMVTQGLMTPRGAKKFEAQKAIIAEQDKNQAKSATRNEVSKAATIGLSRAVGSHNRVPRPSVGAGKRALAQVKVPAEGGIYKNPSVLRAGSPKQAAQHSDAHADKKAATLKPHEAKGQERPSAGSSAKHRASFHQAKVQHHTQEASQPRAKTMQDHSSVVASTHLEQAKSHAIARKGALATIAAGKAKQAGFKAHALQKGKRGGTFYLSEGKKVYAKK